MMKKKKKSLGITRVCVVRVRVRVRVRVCACACASMSKELNLLKFSRSMNWNALSGKSTVTLISDEWPNTSEWLPLGSEKPRQILYFAFHHRKHTGENMREKMELKRPQGTIARIWKDGQVEHPVHSSLTA